MLGKANANDFFLLSRNNKKAPPREEKESDQEKYEVSNEWVASFVENAKCRQAAGERHAYNVEIP
jgi:hypothetical protein